MRWIPWKEIRDEMMKEPGFAEGVEIARQELEAEIAAEQVRLSPTRRANLNKVNLKEPVIA